MTAVQQQAGAGVVAATRHPHSFGSFVKDWFTGGSRTQAVVPALEAFLSAQETYEDQTKAAAGDDDGLDGKSEAELKHAAGLELEVATGAMLRAVMSAETLMSFGVCSDFETNVGTLPVPAVDAELNRVVVFTSQTAVEVSLRARSVGADSSMRHEPQLLFYGIHSKYCQHGDSTDGGMHTAPEFHVCVDPESRHETHLDRHDIFSLISLADAFALESAMRLAVTKPADSAAALAAVAPFNIHLLLNKEEGPSEGTASYSPVMIDIDAGTEATADSSGALALPVFTANDKVARFQLNNLRSNHVVPSTVTDRHAAGKLHAIAEKTAATAVVVNPLSAANLSQHADMEFACILTRDQLKDAFAA